MSKLYINGGNKLNGSLKIQGAKNSVLPILAATVICEDECVIKNCPDLSDVASSFKILKYLGCRCSFSDNTACVFSNGMNKYEIPESLMCEMRSSVIFLGAVLSRAGRAVISNPGGCDLGPRPIDFHLSALEKMGVSIEYEGEKIICNAAGGLNGAEITLSFASVGATENIILAAVRAKGKTVIHNAAREPEIADLADFLNKCGADIVGAGSSTVTVNGVSKLSGTVHTVIPDRIVCATYLSAVAATGGKAILEEVNPVHIAAIEKELKKMGCEIISRENTVEISAIQRLKSIDFIQTGVYPLFPTDAGPLIVSLLAISDGKSVFKENVFNNRFSYVNELLNLGADISVENNTAHICGVNNLNGTVLYCTDLRAGAALVTAALAARGVSEVEGVCFIDRGYEQFEKNLSDLGADIKRV